MVSTAVATFFELTKPVQILRALPNISNWWILGMIVKKKGYPSAQFFFYDAFLNASESLNIFFRANKFSRHCFIFCILGNCKKS